MKVKNIDTFVNLFHCSLRHEVKHCTCDTLLELDSAINDLSLSGTNTDQIVAAFPRLSNSCVDNGAGIAEVVLLGLQERWVKMLVCSKTLHQAVQEKSCEISSLGGHSVCDCLRAYLANFEHVVTVQRDLDGEKLSKHCEALLQVITTVLGFIVTNIRDVKLAKAIKSRRKRKEDEPDFVLIWDDDNVKGMVGSRADCVWYVSIGPFFFFTSKI